MKWKDFKRRYLLVTMLALVALAMIITKITYKAPVVAPNNTIQETVTPTEVEEKVEEKYPLWDRLPYFGEGFTIDRYVEPGLVVVKIQGVDRTIIETLVKNWYKVNGIDPETIEISWEE